MMPNRSQAIVLAEDEHHKMLLYRYLLRRGLSRYDIRIRLAPVGEGSAEQWVRANFATEVRVHRIRSAKTAAALIVIIDADAYTLGARLAQLDQELGKVGIPALRPDEPVARLVPKRNVETWILCLIEQLVEEATDYKGSRDDWNDLISIASQTLFQWTRPNANLPGNCIDSLQRGIAELRRLTF
jgi:hypothetical protein